MTKLIKYFIFFIFSISCSEILFSSEIINLPDGRSINLKSDGTYEFLSTKKTIKVFLDSLNDDGDKCIARFSLENQSYGTIYELETRVKFSDENEEIGTNWVQFYSYDDDKFAKIGGKMFVATRVMDRCDAIRKLELVKIENCVMRNQPEDVECFSLVKTISKVSNVEFTFN